MSSAAPPSFTANVNVIQIDTTAESSKIASVSLYVGRAEVTRVYNFSAATGVNKLVISGLPETLDNNTLRVEGRGKGLIQDVSVTFAEKFRPPTTSETLSKLISTKHEVENVIARSKKCLKGLETYFDTLDVSHVDASQLSAIVENFEAATAKYDSQLLKLQKDYQDTEDAIKAEKARLQKVGFRDQRLRKVANVGFFADKAGDFEIRLIYAVTSTTWVAFYDVRASTQSKDSTLQLIYKAAISQSTGEDWNDVPLTLETTTLSFDSSLPIIKQWKLSVHKRPVPNPSSRMPGGSIFKAASKEKKSKEELEEESDNDMGFGLYDDEAIGHSYAQVISKGNLNATFVIPGLITVPTESTNLTFTIQNLDLQSKLSWIAIPKHDTKSRLTAKITNNSEYPLIPGKANVFVDETFISSIGFPGVSPNETFDCPLGIDPSIRIVYHARDAKAAKSGFYTKSSNITYSQRITIHNSKPAAISELTIIDQIPVSEDSQVAVTLKSPRLALPNSLPGEAKTTPSSVVEAGVTASWYDSNNSGDIAALGKDGKLKWVCALASQKKLNLLLQWEVSFPAQTVVLGLND
ncbi:hypothetical protein CPB84DRAFT_1679836 [Gymnopilus junonius]|uniref:Mucoidy inhibitor A n=1 Tax=Gymnopilus junonius TaxID=109634 RepID=A0A9P5NR86_GYMJU|nr:hypothetical protein CPB84DRAFT_1679836 [Gymnopilus junonius]